MVRTLNTFITLLYHIIIRVDHRSVLELKGWPIKNLSQRELFCDYIWDKQYHSFQILVWLVSSLLTDWFLILLLVQLMIDTGWSTFLILRSLKNHDPHSEDTLSNYHFLVPMVDTISCYTCSNDASSLAGLNT